MALQRVLPGDLITAQQINGMIDAINDLEAQLGGISSSQSNQVIISDLVPPSGTVQVGHELQVIGQNFRFSAGGLQVYLDDTRIDVLTSATDNKVVFNIPGTIVVPQAGRPGVLTINNGLTSAQRTLSLLPLLVLTGAVDVIANGTVPTTPVPGTFTLNFRLRSRASIDTTFAIDPVVSVPAWQASVQVLSAGQAVLSNRQILLAAGAETTFAVRLTIPPGTNGTAFNVNVNASSGEVGGTSGAQPFTVGSAAPQPDPTITLGFGSAQVFGVGTVTSSKITLAQGASATVHLSASFTQPVAHDITAVFLGGATNWEAARVVATTPSPMTITAGELAATGVAAKTLDFGVRPLAGATNGKIEFRILRAGQSQPRTFSMDVQTT
jgi:hypothetical protein